MIHEAESRPFAAALSTESYSPGTAVSFGTSHHTSPKTAVVYAGDYLNKLTGETVERECRRKISEGATELVVNFSRTELVNSIGVSILLGVIDAAASHGARVVFSDVNENTAELFQMLGLTNHVTLI